VGEAELRRDALDADDELAEFRGRNTATEFLACEVHKRLARRIEEGALGSQPITSLRVAPRENRVAWAAYDAPLG
jgi:6-pyruvoyltetrahydropterin/6-carboxytetrahydropterin synthase